MARIEIKDMPGLTMPEIFVLDFLQSNNMMEFTPEEIGQKLQIETRFVIKIIDSLIWKGQPIGWEKHRNKVYFIKNTWRSYAVGGAVFGSMILIILWGFIG